MDNKDISVGSDGSITDDNQPTNGATNIEVKTEPIDTSSTPHAVGSSSEPEVDSTSPPDTNVSVANESVNNDTVGEVKQAPDENLAEENTSDTIAQPVTNIDETPKEEVKVDTKTDATSGERLFEENEEAGVGAVASSATTSLDPLASESATEQKKTDHDKIANDALAAAKAAGKKEHRNNKKFAVFVTVLVAIVLAGAAVFVFLSAESNTQEDANVNETQQLPVNNQPTETVPEPTQPATPEDVDDTTEAIDQTLNSLEESTQQASSEALSDESLGLQ